MFKNKGIYIVLLIVVIALQLMQFFQKEEEGVVFIDNQKVFNEFTMAKELTTKLDSYNTNYKAVLDSLDLELTKRGGELNTQDSIEVKKYLQFKQYCAQQAEQFYTKSNELSNEYNTQIVNQMNSYIEEFGKENNYKVILGANGQGSLLYAQNKIDITDKALIYINNKYAGN